MRQPWSDIFRRVMKIDIMSVNICHGRKSNLVEFQILPVKSPIQEVWVLLGSLKFNKLVKYSNLRDLGIAVCTSVGTIRRMVDYSSVTVYKDRWSLSFYNNHIFSLNLTFPTVPQYPHIF